MHLAEVLGNKKELGTSLCPPKFQEARFARFQKALWARLWLHQSLILVAALGPEVLSHGWTLEWPGKLLRGFYLTAVGGVLTSAVSLTCTPDQEPPLWTDSSQIPTAAKATGSQTVRVVQLGLEFHEISSILPIYIFFSLCSKRRALCHLNFN